MANAMLSRAYVHARSDEIGEKAEIEHAALQRLLKDQRRLTRFLEENAVAMGPNAAGVALYLFGVIARIFDLAGGRLKSATWEQVRDAEQRVGASAPMVLPADDGFVTRARAIFGRAQPHLLDEALFALFERKKKPGEADLEAEESVKIYFMMWVATEVLDQCWSPPKGFAGETEYVFTPVEEKA